MTYKFGFIGAGNMGGALLVAAANGNPSEKFAVYDVCSDKAKGFAEKYENDGYYYKMGVAWLIATALAKQTEKTMNFMETCKLDDFTYNKAIQKAVESRRISPELKVQLKKMKRK